MLRGSGKIFPSFIVLQGIQLETQPMSGMTNTGPSKYPLLIDRLGNQSMDRIKYLSWKLRGTYLSETHPLQMVEALAAVKGTGRVVGSWPSTCNGLPYNAVPQSPGVDTHPKNSALVAHSDHCPCPVSVSYALVEVND